MASVIYVMSVRLKRGLCAARPGQTDALLQIWAATGVESAGEGSRDPLRIGDDHLVGREAAD